ncbi:MAG: hypothetical protein JXB32_14720 [Deltaproteobacteria bacterium]|nr:hypothetical protein [Deltaproteobacteria bacterium]
MRRRWLVVWAAGVGLFPATAFGGDVSQDVAFVGQAVVRVAPGAAFEPAPAVEAAAPVIRLGRVTAGTVEVAAVRVVSLGAGPRTVRLEPGIVRLAVEDDRLRLCVEEGLATVDDLGSVEAGTCALFTGSGERVPLESSEAGLELPASAPSVAPPPPNDDPWKAAAGLLGGAASGDADGGGEGTEAGGAAACLDTGGTGSEASGPEGTELPETEVDRSRHRVQVQVTLEGY